MDLCQTHLTVIHHQITSLVDHVLTGFINADYCDLVDVHFLVGDPNSHVTLRRYSIRNVQLMNSAKRGTLDHFVASHRERMA